MKQLALLLSVLLIAAAPQSGPGDKTYGEPLTIKEVTPLDQILAHPEAFLGKEVRTTGLVYEMCTEMGCWFSLVPKLSSDRMIKIAWAQTDVRFPIGDETVGHVVEIQGKVITSEEEEAAHAEHMAAEGNTGTEMEHEETPAEGAMRTIYVCPMHPDVTSTEPGRCTICRMNLVAREIPVPVYGNVALEGVGAIIKAKPAK